MELRTLLLRSSLGLAIGGLSFWIALNILDRGFYAVFRSVFP
jgi:hypothetical protein